MQDYKQNKTIYKLDNNTNYHETYYWKWVIYAKTNELIWYNIWYSDVITLLMIENINTTG